MQIVDPHHHLWDLSALRYPWLQGAVSEAPFGDTGELRRNYLVNDYLADTASWELVRSVHLQAECDHADSVAETRWLQSVADHPDSCGFPHAIVAFADLSADAAAVDALLAAHRQFRNLRGIRQILSHHHDPRLAQAPRNYLEDARWCENFRLLERHGLSFDAQLYYQQMPLAAGLARRYGGTTIIINHTGTPAEKDQAGRAGWRAGMRALAACDNVAVKISGLGMFDPHWTVDSIRPFVLETIEMFGVGRCMFASNFPVDRLFGSFDRLFGTFAGITASFSGAEQRALFHDNAVRIYRL